ncbi:hypothetical protein [Xylanibacter muris]|nr:hypothetical protein [Xylanibacter muris]
MNNLKMKTGVVVMTLTSSVYMGNIRRTYRSRIGFECEMILNGK